MTSRKKSKGRDKVMRRIHRGLNVLNYTLSTIRKVPVIPCIDVECFEWMQSRVLEIGVSYIDTRSMTLMDTDHYVVEEHYSCRNRKYVCDNKDNFDFGVSQIVKLETVKLALSTIMKQHSVIAAFGVSGDCQHLRGIGIYAPEVRIDVPKLYDAIYLDPLDGPAHSSRGLHTVAETFGHPLIHPHNAGNDAHVTALCLVDILKKVRDDGPAIKQHFEHLKCSRTNHNEYMKFIYEDG